MIQIQEAIQLMLQWHEGQTRKKGAEVPLYSHLLAVHELALQYGADRELSIAALWHEAMESKDWPEIKKNLLHLAGPRVHQIVLSCVEPSTPDGFDFYLKKNIYLDYLKKLPPEPLFVLACDELHDARTILSAILRFGDTIWADFKGGREGTLWYYHELCPIFERSGAFELHREFRFTVEKIQQILHENRWF